MDMDRKKALKLLEIEQSSPTPEELKAAYRRLAKTCHPDLKPGCKASEERFKELSAAYKYLKENPNNGLFGSIFKGTVFDMVADNEKLREKQKKEAAEKAAKGEPEKPEATVPPSVPAKREAFNMEDALDVFRTVVGEAGSVAATGLSNVLTNEKVQDGARNFANNFGQLIKEAFNNDKLEGAGDKLAKKMDNVGKSLKKRGPDNDPGSKP